MNEHHSYRLVIDYDPGSGLARVCDAWDKADGQQGFLSLVTTNNIHRQGRENLYREVKQHLGTYFDILDGRHREADRS